VAGAGYGAGGGASGDRLDRPRFIGRLGAGVRSGGHCHQAFDVFTSETPLVGQFSLASNLSGEPTFTPGPLLFWLLAVPARLPGVAAFPLVMGALNAAAVVGTVALAHRRGGRQLMFMTAAAVALMCASFQTEVTREIWNASAPLLLLTLQVFVCWSLACGEYRLLPLAVLLTSFEMQTYLTYLIPSVGLLGAGIVGLVVSRTREPARRGQRDKATGRANRSFRRWLLAALAVGLLCWSAPLMDQALAWVGANRGYGNLANLADAARSREAPLGPTGGAYAIVRALGIPPSWLRAPQSEAERVFEIFGRPDPLALVSSAAILIGLVICLVVAVRRRRPDVVAACGLALVLAGRSARSQRPTRTPPAPFSRTATARGGPGSWGCGRGCVWGGRP
jgi:hypothetical protein